VEGAAGAAGAEGVAGAEGAEGAAGSWPPIRGRYAAQRAGAQDEVALRVVTLLVELDHLELEGEVIAERAVQPEVGLLIKAEQPLDRTYDGEDGVLTRALLLCERPDGGLDSAAQQGCRRIAVDRGDRRARAQRSLNRRQQHLAALIERAHGELAATRLEAKGRISKAHGPPGVAAGKVVRGLEQAAAVRFELVDQLLQRLLWLLERHLTHVNDDAASRLISAERGVLTRRSERPG
jgi:hypothetical protein